MFFILKYYIKIVLKLYYRPSHQAFLNASLYRIPVLIIDFTIFRHRDGSRKFSVDILRLEPVGNRDYLDLHLRNIDVPSSVGSRSDFPLVTDTGIDGLFFGERRVDFN